MLVNMNMKTAKIKCEHCVCLFWFYRHEQSQCEQILEWNLNDRLRRCPYLRIPSAGLPPSAGPRRACGGSLARHKLEFQVSLILAERTGRIHRRAVFVAGAVRAVEAPHHLTASGEQAASPTAAYASAHAEREGHRARVGERGPLQRRPAKNSANVL